MLDMQCFLFTRYWHLKRSFTDAHRFYIPSTALSCSVFVLLGLTRTSCSSTWWPCVLDRLSFPAEIRQNLANERETTIHCSPILQLAAHQDICIAMLRAMIGSHFPRPNSFRQTIDMFGSVTLHDLILKANFTTVKWIAFWKLPTVAENFCRCDCARNHKVKYNTSWFRTL